MVSEIQTQQTFPPARTPARLDTMSENSIPTALKGKKLK